jgi:putative ABC transport system permease protein
VVDLGVLTRALRNVSRRKTRVLLVVVALGFSMAIMISIPAGIVANQVSTESLTEDYENIIGDMEEEINKTLTLVECSLSLGFSFGSRPGSMPGFMPGAEEEFMDESAVDDIGSIEGVKDVVPYLEKTEGTYQTMETPRGTFERLVPDYTIIGVPLNSSLIDNYLVLPSDIIEGRNLDEGDSGVVLLSLNNTEYFGVGLGDEVYILEDYFEVVGVYETSDSLGLNKLYMNISDAQEITSLEGKISKLDVYAEDESNVDEIVNEIVTIYPEFYLTTYEERLSQLETMKETYQGTLENAEASIAQTQATAFQEIVIAIVATSLIVLFTMLYTVRERTKEIGVLKAIGFSNWSVMSQFMVEGILMSLMAGVVGVVIGIVGAPILSSLLLPHVSLFPTQGQRQFGTPGQAINPGIFQSESAAVALDPQTLLLAFGAAVLLGALGSLYPAWRASRTSPMEALRYE